MRITRLLPLLALSCVALPSQAFLIDLASAGHYSVSSDNSTITSNETVVFQATSDPMPMFNTLNFSVSNFVPFTGAGTYTNGTDSLNFTFEYTLDVPFDPSSGTVTAHGLWTYAGGTGAYAGLAGSGVLATNFNPAFNQSDMSIFSGSLEAVPEPTSMAIIGIGAAGLLRRRTKKQ